MNLGDKKLSVPVLIIKAHAMANDAASIVGAELAGPLVDGYVREELAEIQRRRAVLAILHGHWARLYGRPVADRVISEVLQRL